MKAVLLAAGKGTRLRPLTDAIPKVMIPVKGKPILEYHLEQLAAAGIKAVLINLHHLPEKIKGYFQDGQRWGVNIRYSYEPEILGTAGAVRKLRGELEAEPFLVIYGDNYLQLNYANLIEYSERRGGIGTVVVFEKKDVSGSGIVEIGPGQRVLRFVEKPKSGDIFSHWVNAGVYYFRPKVLQFIKPKHSDFGYDLLPDLLKRGENIFAYKLKGEVRAVDSPRLLDQLRMEQGEEG
jgi:NDP-sugar pyrophosphorylase family protein